MIALETIAVAAAVLLVRIGWGGRRGAAPLGWAVAAAVLILLGFQHGAWGIAVGTVAAMAAAFAILLWAGWSSPARAWRPAREAPAATLPRRWSGLGRRLSVFVLVVPAACAAALWLAFGVQGVLRRAGASEVNGTVTLLFLLPILWCVLMTWQMTQSGPRRMVAPPLLAAALGTLLWMVA